MQQFVSVFVGVYVLLILVYILLSWVPVGSSSALERVRTVPARGLRALPPPVPARHPPLGPLDLSPIVAILALTVGARVVNGLIGQVTLTTEGSTDDVADTR